jgi:hypothetical protein
VFNVHGAHAELSRLKAADVNVHLCLTRHLTCASSQASAAAFDDTQHRSTRSCVTVLSYLAALALITNVACVQLHTVHCHDHVVTGINTEVVL